MDWRSKVILLAVMGSGVAAAHQNRVVDDFRLIDLVLQSFRVDAGRYPTEAEGLKALVERPSTYPPDKPWKGIMKEYPTDPWGNPYHYVTSPNLERGYGLYSNGSDGVSNSDGNDPDDWNSWSEDNRGGTPFMDRLGEAPLMLCLAVVAYIFAVWKVIRGRVSGQTS
jgi:general secretion pathway protein G